MARSSDFPVSWSCADGSRVSIAAGTGGMTITPKGGLLVRLPYAGAMSRHHGWGKYTECYAEDAPCAEGGMSDDRRHRQPYPKPPSAANIGGALRRAFAAYPHVDMQNRNQRHAM